MVEVDFEWERGHEPEDMQDALQKFESVLDDEVSAAAERIIENVLDDVQELAPVDTGELRDSYQTETERILEAIIEARVFSDVEHAPYQEFMDIGTPHVGPALEKNKETFESEAEKAWNAAVREVT
ncbi:HK97 gp10 family phage protein [Haloferax volcanii]|uniref:HK97 gp10 family phage protein n=1 Tax=Haloferax volcanii TaxID=2246 RepID=UPI00249AE02A|nr:HK97 gp10 family phage protein [Haloferax alexandrinus]WEL29851.1 HK97 gp10 family phage protein [Haloferax alexandrinus]